VLLIVLTVIMAASAMEVAGGIDFLVRIAEKIIRKNPKQVTIVAPLVTYGFTFAAGTGHIVYPLLPVIYEVAHENGIRPERPLAVATIASQQAITASPVSAATAAMIGLLAPHGYGLVQILLICVPSTLLAVLIAAFAQLRVGKELKDDPEYQRLLASGELQPPGKASGAEPPPLKKGAKASAIIFPPRRRDRRAGGHLSRGPHRDRLGGGTHGTQDADCHRDRHAHGGCGHSHGHQGSRRRSAEVQDVPVGRHRDRWHLGPRLARRLIHQCESRSHHRRSERHGQGRAVDILDRAVRRVDAALQPGGDQRRRSCRSAFRSASRRRFSSACSRRVNGYFFIPNYGTLIAAMQFRPLPETTRIGKYLLNHSFMLPASSAPSVRSAIGLLIRNFLQQSNPLLP
jgi:hypothetical protein